MECSTVYARMYHMAPSYGKKYDRGTFYFTLVKPATRRKVEDVGKSEKESTRMKGAERQSEALDMYIFVIWRLRTVGSRLKEPFTLV